MKIIFRVHNLPSSEIAGIQSLSLLLVLVVSFLVSFSGNSGGTPLELSSKPGYLVGSPIGILDLGVPGCGFGDSQQLPIAFT